MVSFLTEDGQIDLYGSQLAACQCYQIAREVGPSKDGEPLSEPANNHEVFAWAHSDMTGIHPSIASHRLNILPSSRPVWQKRSRLSGLTSKCSGGPKKEGKWRVCVDYTNLNNACPKDSFPLPWIDQIVDSTAGQGNAFLPRCLLRIPPNPYGPCGRRKNSLYKPYGLYCYKLMPFGLKNASATYQRLMTKIFRPLVGRTMEVYIDDIVVKSKTREDHAHHLQEVFHLLRSYDMKLNPSKCAFGMSAGKFLGFMVTQRGIEVSPDQIKTVMEAPP
ncbi:Transposon Ty3-I Gag-Pol polyprotein [Vitis vinifera]|uniref:Transposon Ty3-I Gag-Pol polyprotein n=1 Tax=Vitis vinifera TaxID=29760 RepID=A0A438G839_VITVI|nr:Transposon Ty3-I Gag-Pol polyprotein [Vitis vinifera]